MAVETVYSQLGMSISTTEEVENTQAKNKAHVKLDSAVDVLLKRFMDEMQLIITLPKACFV